MLPVAPYVYSLSARPVRQCLALYYLWCFGCGRDKAITWTFIYLYMVCDFYIAKLNLRLMQHIMDKLDEPELSLYPKIQ